MEDFLQWRTKKIEGKTPTKKLSVLLENRREAGCVLAIGTKVAQSGHSGGGVVFVSGMKV